jgi:hypothetical protein
MYRRNELAPLPVIGKFGLHVGNYARRKDAITIGGERSGA